MPRRLLLLSYYYPPTASVGGVRAAGLAKYLPRFGWEATVITPVVAGRAGAGAGAGADAAGAPRLIETADRDTARRLKQLLGLQPDAALKDLAAGGDAAPPAARTGRSAAIELLKALVAFPDAHRGWARLAAEAASGASAEAAAAARAAPHPAPYSAILATSPPHSVHLGAARAARATGLPWIADLRDLWSTDRNSVAPAWRKRLEARMERRTFATASALVTVSEPLAAELRALYPELPAHAIPNGFDPELAGLAAGPSTGLRPDPHRDLLPGAPRPLAAVRRAGVAAGRGQAPARARQGPALREARAVGRRDGRGTRPRRRGRGPPVGPARARRSARSRSRRACCCCTGAASARPASSPGRSSSTSRHAGRSC